MIAYNRCIKSLTVDQRFFMRFRGKVSNTYTLRWVIRLKSLAGSTLDDIDKSIYVGHKCVPC